MVTDRVMKFKVGMDSDGNQYLYGDNEEVVYIHPKYLTEKRLCKAISDLHSNSFYNCYSCKNIIVMNYMSFVKLQEMFDVNIISTQNNCVLGFEIKIDNSSEMIYVM